VLRITSLAKDVKKLEIKYTLAYINCVIKSCPFPYERDKAVNEMNSLFLQSKTDL